MQGMLWATRATTEQAGVRRKGVALVKDIFAPQPLASPTLFDRSDGYAIGTGYSVRSDEGNGACSGVSCGEGSGAGTGHGSGDAYVKMLGYSTGNGCQEGDGYG
jgi:hypothetical protein